MFFYFMTKVSKRELSKQWDPNGGFSEEYSPLGIKREHSKQWDPHGVGDKVTEGTLNQGDPSERFLRTLSRNT